MTMLLEILALTIFCPFLDRFTVEDISRSMCSYQNSFYATGGVCKKIKINDNTYSNSIFLYEGVMQIKDQRFTVMSMLSEKHDNVSIYMWLKRWLRCEVKPPKISITQSLALMSATVTFTQYDSLEKYIEVCFLLARGKKIEIPYSVSYEMI